MGKYKKYAKTEQYMDQLKKFLPNNSTIPNSNQRNNNINDNTKLNNKNGLSNNYLKKEDSSFKLIMWEIFEAIKSFFNICKNFLIPSEIPYMQKFFNTFRNSFKDLCFIYYIRGHISRYNIIFSKINKSSFGRIIPNME